jgi:anti-sigma factor RsiW
MTPSEMLDYVLGVLDEPRRTELERQIVADPALAETSRRFAARLVRLLDDGQQSARSVNPHPVRQNRQSEYRADECSGASGSPNLESG